MARKAKPLSPEGELAISVGFSVTSPFSPRPADRKLNNVSLMPEHNGLIERVSVERRRIVEFFAVHSRDPVARTKPHLPWRALAFHVVHFCLVAGQPPEVGP